MDIPDAAVNAVSDAIGLDQYDARDALEAAAPILAAVRAKDLRAALRSITARITTSAADFSTYEPDAWVYGIAVGWDCEEDHGHDDICGGTAAMDELAARHGWDEAAVARLRGHRKAYATATASAPTGAVQEDGGS
jgi:hypothetical protein